LIHLFKDSNSIFYQLKIFQIRTDKHYISALANEIGLDFSLIDLIDLLCREKN